jgi:enediyne polyketide synthase
MTPAIAIVGLACRYPDARSPAELWENALAQRRAFRRLPPERLRLEDYLDADRHAADRTYSTEAAVIEGWEFDRLRFRVSGSTYRAVDLTHWLALDVAAQALADAGYAEADGLPRETCGVLVGNTLCGEFSRAALMRLRWPYVSRLVEAALRDEGWSTPQRGAFVAKLEEQYKAPFAPVGEETLAGGLSNTIAGRICNHFDLKGGGYTVDGACAASLLAITTACTALANGDLDVALAGGVDLSLDPFELVGFAKAGALAAEEMRVYDAQSAGFWPGEGCGFVVLMRHADALAEGRRVYAVIRGWGVSSDGSGGLTRPEVGGQILAVRRAYRRAGFGIDSVSYIEGHGAGTTVGDITELTALSRALREAGGRHRVAIGSIKANIGHTKAAAGVAGFIKAAMALRVQIVPPAVGCEVPHPALLAPDALLRVPREPEPWPLDRPLRAGVSAMGFGGINTHVVLEGATGERRMSVGSPERALGTSHQDTELFLMAAPTPAALRARAEHLLGFAARLSRSELADLASELERRLEDGRMRAAVVAGSPAALEKGLRVLATWMSDGIETRVDAGVGVFLGSHGKSPRIGFLFPGQGSSTELDGGAWRRRFDFVRELYSTIELPADGDGVDTAVAQPAIVAASIAGLRALAALGIAAVGGVGHSLGELTALHWAGVLDGAAALRIAGARGRAMAELRSPTGAMASIESAADEVAGLLRGELVVIAGINAPRRTVISGEIAAVTRVVARAAARGLRTVRLSVSHAFHSPLVAAAVPALRAHLTGERLRPLARTVFSTVTGGVLTPGDDLSELLCRQVTTPVRFADAAALLAKDVDLLIEVGPGEVLSGIVAEFTDRPVVALDAGGTSLRGLLAATGACFALGAAVEYHALFSGRFTRRFDLDWRPRFLANPCEQAPTPEASSATAGALTVEPALTAKPGVADPSIAMIVPPVRGEPLVVVRQLVAERAELPLTAVTDASRLLSDLHLNSIVVAQLVVEAAHRLGRKPPTGLTDWSRATVGEVSRALSELVESDGEPANEETHNAPAGLDTWVRAFVVELVERPRPQRRTAAGQEACGWEVFAPLEHPLAPAIREALAFVAGRGVVLGLPADVDERHVGLMLAAAHAALAVGGPTRFVLLEHGGGGAALARTLFLEAPHISTCVIDCPADDPRAVGWVLAEIEATSGYVEAHYDTAGRRHEPVLRLLAAEHDHSAKLPGPSDVLLVSGGGKGIAAECALALARRTGVRLILIGRSRPMADTDLATNLERMVAAGVTFRYVAADVTDADEVLVAVRRAESELGHVTGVLHGAGVNVPRPLAALDEVTALRTIAPKVRGLRNILASVEPQRLRWLLTFGSVIARIGLAGEADYALANAWLASLVEGWQKAHPHCRCLNIEWSIWSGTGMGERLGRVDALMRAGVTPISVDQGIAVFGELLTYRLPGSSVVVGGRLGPPTTLRLARPELPFLRFLERPRVNYPGVELVTEAELSRESDPYLDDHVFDGQRLWPAVMGLEAMAQVAMALVGATRRPVFERVRFLRPIAVDDGEPLTVRIVALARGTDSVDVAVRTSATLFQTDHFEATCRFIAVDHAPAAEEQTPRGSAADSAGVVTSRMIGLDPSRDLYDGGLLFQRGRFRRVIAYQRLRSTECEAEIDVQDAHWFGRHLPARLVLGDAGARDALIHMIQACVPHGTLLPIGVERIVPIGQGAKGPWRARATERGRDGDLFTYDVEVSGEDGRPLERWEGLQLKIVASRAPADAWVPELLAPYIERRLTELSRVTTVAVALERRSNGLGAPGVSGKDEAIWRATGDGVAVWRRSDGKPEILDGKPVAVSVAHAGDLVLVVAGSFPLACDLEPVVTRPELLWRDLIGREGFDLAKLVANERGETQEVAATRVWAATECLKKSGLPPCAPLTFLTASDDGWVLLGSGALGIASVPVLVQHHDEPLVVAVLFGAAARSMPRLSVRNEHSGRQ